jgi:hypothetical protein
MVLLGTGDGDAGRRVEWVKPIGELEADFRRQGVFMLADFNAKRLRFYGYDSVVTNRLVDAVRGRTQEMVDFLVARLRVQRGETT